MKHKATARIVVLAVMLGALIAGCATTPEKKAYGKLSTIAISVDTGMKMYGGLVAAGKINGADQVRVQNAYSTYQASMLTAITAAQIWTSDSMDVDTSNDYIAKAADTAAILLQLIDTLTKD